MELKQLKFLIVCAEVQSFSRAAEHLYTAQSNVSKVIKSLEEELGTELFERKQYGISLTEKGRQIYEYARNTVENAKKIEEIAKTEATGELRILTNPSTWMASAFCEYYKQHQTENVSYSVFTASTSEIIRRLSGNIDHIGFIYIMEPQLSILQNKLEKSHLQFLELSRTDAVLFKGMGRADAKGMSSPQKLVQLYDDEFSLNSYWNSNAEENISDVAVLTNSDYILNELLDHTNLSHLGNLHMGKKDSNHTRESEAIYDDDTSVLFGCFIRNDQPLSFHTKRFLNYIQNKSEDELK